MENAEGESIPDEVGGGLRELRGAVHVDPVPGAVALRSERGKSLERPLPEQVESTDIGNDWIIVFIVIKLLNHTLMELRSS